MNYKTSITVGQLGGYSPDEVPFDLWWFEGRHWMEYPDSTKRQAYLKHFILTFSEGYTDRFDNWIKNDLYTEIEDLDCLYLIKIPFSVWKIEHLYKGYDSSLCVQQILPYAWGYRKCSSFDKLYRPTGYTACKDVFDYITQKMPVYSKSFTEDDNKIDAILHLQNKYFEIQPIEEEKTTAFCYPEFSSIHNYYYTVFYEKRLPETKYQIYYRDFRIKEEISNKIQKIFIPVAIGVLFFITILGWYCIKNIKKDR